MFNRMLKLLLPGEWKKRGAANVDRNTDTLARIEDTNPVYRVMMDHAFAQFANDMMDVLDPALPSDRRLAAADSASGLRKFIEDIEARRMGWVAERKAEEARAKTVVG